jgi:hypothetical protein
MVGAALMVAGVVAAVVEVVLPPIDMVPVALAVCCWPTAAASAPRVTTPIAAIAAACHLSFRFCILPLTVRSFATSPRRNGPRYSYAYPRCLGFFFGIYGKPLEIETHQSSPGCSSLAFGACLAGVACGAATGAVAWVQFGASVATLMMWSTCLRGRCMRGRGVGIGSGRG